MIKSETISGGRANKLDVLNVDLCVVGGGLAGVCTAIAAAREGITVCLIQDRPVLGGNASSEVRLWSLGATSHMGNNNRYSREGGIIDELMLENLHRNAEGNPVILDTVLLEKVIAEDNIRLLLNTSAYATVKDSASAIAHVEAFCSQNSTSYQVHATVFCDASGDGVMAFQSGAAFRMGAEARSEFNELLAPESEQHDLLGHSIYFYSKDTGKPVNFVAPEFATLDKVTEDRIKRISPTEYGSRLWWLEYGGSKDTIHDSEEIKMQLWKVVYGVWDYVKNSGKFDDVENLTLEWVGSIPGKRESRRFDGHYMLTQQDVVDQTDFDDAVSYGGWSIDHHPSDGIYSDKAPCRQYHSKGVYQIPLRCFMAKEIDNLFFAGRIISASHIAFGSTRVMSTSAHGGQAVGVSAAHCIQNKLPISALLEQHQYRAVQQKLNRLGHFIPNRPFDAAENLISQAQLKTSSTLSLTELVADGPWLELSDASCQMLPMKKDIGYQVSFVMDAQHDTEVEIQLRVSSKTQNYTPDVILETQAVKIPAGESIVKAEFSKHLSEDQFGFICLMQNPAVKVRCSKQRVTSVLSLFNAKNEAVSNHGKQEVEDGIGIDSFEFWIPHRRPQGHNLAFNIQPAIEDFSAKNLTNGYPRPYIQSNAWIADFSDKSPQIDISWPERKPLTELYIHFDADFDHALESSLMGHPENRMPFCPASFRVYGEAGELLLSQQNNHQNVCKLVFEKPIVTNQLSIQIDSLHEEIPVSVFEVIAR